MRIIYLSTTKEKQFQTKESTIEFFKRYLSGEKEHFNFSKGKIDKKKFQEDEDIFFLRADKVFDNYTYEIVAYCQASSDVMENTPYDEEYPYYFKINLNTLKIFNHFIDAQYLQNFINNKANGIKDVNLIGNIKDNQFSGPNSWIYFDEHDSQKIKNWINEMILRQNITSISIL